MKLLDKNKSISLTKSLKKGIEYVQSTSFSLVSSCDSIFFTKVNHCGIIPEITIKIHLANQDMVQEK
jgi:hypothetical protein